MGVRHVQVGMAISELPEDMTPLRQLKRVYEQRREMVESGKGIDWGFAEALAFGTLLSEGACSCATHSASELGVQPTLRMSRRRAWLEVAWTWLFEVKGLLSHTQMSGTPYMRHGPAVQSSAHAENAGQVQVDRPRRQGAV